MLIRDVLKSIGRGLALVVALPSIVSFSVRRKLLGGNRALIGLTPMLALVPGIAGR